MARRGWVRMFNWATKITPRYELSITDDWRCHLVLKSHHGIIVITFSALLSQWAPIVKPSWEESFRIIAWHIKEGEGRWSFENPFKCYSPTTLKNWTLDIYYLAKREGGRCDRAEVSHPGRPLLAQARSLVTSIPRPPRHLQIFLEKYNNVTW